MVIDKRGQGLHCGRGDHKVRKGAQQGLVAGCDSERRPAFSRVVWEGL